MVIVNALPMTIGRHRGALSAESPDDLGSQVIAAAIDRAHIDAAIIEEF